MAKDISPNSDKTAGRKQRHKNAEVQIEVEAQAKDLRKLAQADVSSSNIDIETYLSDCSNIRGTSIASHRAIKNSTEVVIHELGESIVAAIDSVQQELARYPREMGAYVLDEVDLNIPVQLRVDSLGQVMATVVESQTSNPVGGQLRLRFRSILDAAQPTILASHHPLIDLQILSEADIAKLEAMRIFSVNDLLRVTRNISGRKAIAKLNPKIRLNDLLERAKILTLSVLPFKVAESLLQIGINKLIDFIKSDPEDIARQLTRLLEQDITSRDVRIWQCEINKLIALSLPSSKGLNE